MSEGLLRTPLSCTAFEDGGRGHEPRNAGGRHPELETETDSPLEHRHLGLSPRGLFQASDSQNRETMLLL